MDTAEFEREAVKHGIIGYKVTQNGRTVARKLFCDDCRYDVHSACKSVTSFAVGKAVEEGLISLDEKLIDAFKSDAPDCPSEFLCAATVKDLLTMRLGLKEQNIMGVMRPFYKRDDWVAMCLEAEFCAMPGTKFMYNNVGPYLAAVLIQRRAKTSLVDYLMPRLFSPLDIPRPTWETDRSGNNIGADGLLLTLDELHEFGLLYLDGGVRGGRRLIDPNWIEQSTKDIYGDGYGYLFWVSDNSYCASGKFGQRCAVYPDKNAVVTFISFDPSGDISKCAERFIYPCL